MIRIISGNYWSVPANVMVNTVNCVGVMGKGIAREFKERYYQMFLDYNEYCRIKQLRPGGMFRWKSSDTLEIWNVATKDHWRDESKYEWVAICLNNIRTWLDRHQKEQLQVSIPALGCGNGGLRWDLVSNMICERLKQSHHWITVFNPPGGNLSLQVA